MTQTEHVHAAGPLHEIGENEQILRELIELRGHRMDSITDSARTYDELHAEGYLRQKDSFYMWLLSLLRHQPGQTLLEVSCGQGMLMQWAIREGLRVAGLDLSSLGLHAAAQRAAAASIVQADAERMPFRDGAFDYVTNIGSLEHYFRPHWALREMARVLRTEGLALILLPNTFGLLGNILHVWRHGDVFDDGQPLQRYGTKVQWRRLLELNGLKIIRTVKFERARPRTWQDLFWYAARPHKLVRVLLTPIVPQNLASFLVYQCRKGRS